MNYALIPPQEALYRQPSEVSVVLPPGIPARATGAAAWALLLIALGLSYWSMRRQ